MAVETTCILQIIFAKCLFRQAIGIPMGTNCAQGCLELYNFRACNNLRFSSDFISEIPAIGKNFKKGFLSLVEYFCSCKRKKGGSENGNPPSF